MDLSLIVCTRDRGEKLRHCLEHIEHIGRIEFEGSWELLVVDNASTDATAEVIDSFAAKAQVPVKRLWAPEPGLARARNVGLAHAAGELIVFTDDDCYPTPSYLTDVVQLFTLYRVDYLGGKVALYDLSDAKVTVHKDAKNSIRWLPPHSRIRSGTIKGANMAFRRAVAETIAGFDPLLGAGTRGFSGEDTDFLIRASAAGFRGGYFPTAVVYHHHGRKPGPEVAALRRGYQYGRGAVLAKSLLSPWTRSIYARASIRSALRRPVWMTLRELRGALRYVTARLREPRSPTTTYGEADGDVSNWPAV